MTQKFNRDPNAKESWYTAAPDRVALTRESQILVYIALQTHAAQLQLQSVWDLPFFYSFLGDSDALFNFRNHCCPWPGDYFRDLKRPSAPSSFLHLAKLSL